MLTNQIKLHPATQHLRLSYTSFSLVTVENNGFCVIQFFVTHPMVPGEESPVFNEINTKLE